MTLTGFDVTIAALVGALTLADFLIGPVGRRQLRAWASALWIYLDDRSYGHLFTETSRRAKKFMRRYFGNPFTLTSLLLLATLAGLVMYAYPTRMAPYMPDGPPYRSTMHILSDLLHFRVPGREDVPVGLLFIAGFASYLLVLGLSFISQWRSPRDPDLFSPDPEKQMTGWEVMALGATLLGNCLSMIAVESVLGAEAMLFVLTGCYWLWAPEIVAAIVLLLKVTAPVVRRAVMLVLYRFQESEKGSLTLLSVFLGGLAKFLQVVLKGGP